MNRARLRTRFTIPGEELRAGMARERAANEEAERIVLALEEPHGPDLGRDLLGVSALVRRQLALPRDGGRDGRFLAALDHAVRDGALRGAGQP